MLLLIEIMRYWQKINLFNLSNKFKLISDNFTKKITNLEEKLKFQQNELNHLNRTYINKYKEIILNISQINNILKELINENLIEKSIKEQNDFCNNQSKDNNKYEERVKLKEVDLNNKNYKMFIYKYADAVSHSIKYSKRWEDRDTNNIINALNYYSNKTNIKKEDIYIMDLGANIGWYSFYLGKNGYKILSFEPDPINYYILRKNYCINKDVNIIIINRGVYSEEKKCDYYLHIGNEGNGLIFCDKNSEIQKNILKYKEEVYLTKLSNFIPFLSDKNLAFIKIDVEGAEEKAIKGGIELITKYHVPFIFMEWAPNNLRMQKVDKREFLLLFENNGYKFSLSNFLDKNFIILDDIVNSTKLINIYIIYANILE